MNKMLYELEYAYDKCCFVDLDSQVAPLVNYLHPSNPIAQVYVIFFITSPVPLANNYFSTDGKLYKSGFCPTQALSSLCINLSVNHYGNFSCHCLAI